MRSWKRERDAANIIIMASAQATDERGIGTVVTKGRSVAPDEKGHNKDHNSLRT